MGHIWAKKMDLGHNCLLCEHSLSTIIIIRSLVQHLQGICINFLAILFSLAHLCNMYCVSKNILDLG